MSNGTNGRVYGGACDLIHVADGQRAKVGKLLAVVLDDVMRKDAHKRGDRSFVESHQQQLCPGCYMIVGLDMLVELARANGQPLTELANSMAAAFTYIANAFDADDYDAALTEEIAVILDKED